ncbi:MAG: hypothetical protein Q8P90_00780 [bacterium]|nr:hypothetical protein [bacterium]
MKNHHINSKKFNSAIKFFYFFTAVFFTVFLVLPTSASANTRVNTVEFYAGTYSGNGSTGRLTNTSYQFPASTLTNFDFKLAETGVDIVDAYLEVDVIYEAYTDSGQASTGHVLGFDACSGSCNPDPISGTGAVVWNNSSTIAYNETESNRQKLILNVTAEDALAAYTGGGTNLRFQSSYQVKSASTTYNSLSNAYAKLVVTYTYDDTSTNFTNHVVYPLNVNYISSSGSSRTVRSKNCTKNANCPLFSYNITVPEITTGSSLQNWFELSAVNDLNASNDIAHDINIYGVDVDSSIHVHEAALGTGQGNTFEYQVQDLTGVTQNSGQYMEWYHYSAGTNADLYMQGGEINQTYTAARSAGTKTKTVRYPMGEIANDANGSSTYSKVSTVYFPESGVNIKSAWFRIYTDYDTGVAATIDVNAKVGANSATPVISYALDGANTVPNATLKNIYIIPSSEYTTLDNATADSYEYVYAYVKPSVVDFGGVSGELMITYTYTDDTEYQQSIMLRGINQTGTSTTITTNPGPNIYMSGNGTATMIKAVTKNALTISNIQGTMPTTTMYLDSDSHPTVTPTCPTKFYVSPLAGYNSYIEFYNQQTAIDSTVDQNYRLCAGISGGSSTVAQMNSNLIYTYKFISAPDKPTVTSAPDANRNPTLGSSTYSGARTHTSSQWTILESAASVCTDAGSNVVWNSGTETVNKTAITVNSTTGTFLNSLSGQTSLGASTDYKACVRYTNAGGTSDWSDPVAFNTNIPPTVTQIYADLGRDPIYLTENSTYTVETVLEVTDPDGCSDIDHVYFRLFRQSLGQTCTLDDNNCYLASCTDSGSCGASPDTTSTYSCDVDMQYYAEPTDTGVYAADFWRARAYPFDAAGSGNFGDDDVEVATLLAFSPTASINFGTLGPGEDTGTFHPTLSIKNTGNTQLDLQLSVYGDTPGDNKSMSCPTTTLLASRLKYDLNPFTYSSGGTQATSAGVDVFIDVPKSTGSASSKPLYTGISIGNDKPPELCTGTMVLTAI